MSDSFTEIGILWVGKKSVATGVISCAAPVVLDPEKGVSLVVQKIDYPKGKPDKAPDFRLSLAREDNSSTRDNDSDPKF